MSITIETKPASGSLSDDGSSSTVSDHVTLTEGTTATGKDSEDSDTSEAIKNRISKKETKAVHLQKIVVLLIMMLATITVCLVVYTITSTSETEDFESHFDAAAEKLVISFQEVLHKVGSISSIDIAATVYGMDHPESRWPFLTLSSFAERSATARVLSGVLLVSIDPSVTDDDRKAFEEYAATNENIWKDEGLAYQKKMGFVGFENIEASSNVHRLLGGNSTAIPIHYRGENGELIVDEGPGPYVVTWLTSPVLKTYDINYNLYKDQSLSLSVKKCVEEETVIFGGFESAPAGTINSTNATTSYFATLNSFNEEKIAAYEGSPMARIYLPVYDSFEAGRNVIAVTMAIINWRYYFTKRLPSTMKGVTIVLENACDGSYTYVVNGREVQAVGFGDLHDRNFDGYDRQGSFEEHYLIKDGSKQGLSMKEAACPYRFHVYPSQTFYDTYNTSTPFIVTFSVALVFAFMIGMFVVYDCLVERRQKIVLHKAAKSTAIVSSLFPKQVRDRLLDDTFDRKGNNIFSGANQLKSFLSGGENGVGSSNQMADLFPNCTILFADVVGFTAWSSSREPQQVFILLQTIYNNFDQIAKRRRVFKVETIGDCYLAVTGLPDPQANHAVIMARFAYECRQKLKEVVRELSVTLGPGTSDLSMKFGMHSGPVTAGILGGDRARFQLFGDSVNTAARMESTGAPDKIQISRTSAEQLKAAGKEHWLKPRDDIVNAKGLGSMQTFWLQIGTKKAYSITSSQDDVTASEGTRVTDFDEPDDLGRQEQLVNWIVEVLLGHIKNMIAKRHVGKSQVTGDSTRVSYCPKSGTTCLDEVQDVIRMVEFEPNNSSDIVVGNGAVEFDNEAIKDLHEFISMIACMYHVSNPFHNFEHACHVTLSVNKLLKRIDSPELPEDVVKTIASNEENYYEKYLHKYTYGISSDPLAHFAIVFSALIHDVDHRGCSNVQLVKEEAHLGSMYKDKSVAEQNSLDLSWNLLMSERFTHLRCALFETNEELFRFRQFIVNVVLATDIFDKELNDRRKARWMKAFSENSSMDDDKDHCNRKATIVIEHIIQASDVSHTMQHWQVYRKWNRLLFCEMYEAYIHGRMATNPAEFWYKGELSFFDNYIIPLGKKLKDCNVFGVSSDEYLNYAVCNRAEWEEKGEAIVEELIAELRLRTDNDE